MVKFKRNKDGLYVDRPSRNYLKEVASDTEHGDDETSRGEIFLVGTIKENKQGFTARQFEDAKQARKLYHILVMKVRLTLSLWYLRPFKYKNLSK
jgi:hypothetical protein